MLVHDLLGGGTVLERGYQCLEGDASCGDAGHPIGAQHERHRLFRAEIEGSAERAVLKHAFDRWCAVWFWPVEDEAAPLLLPDDFASPGPDLDRVVRELQERHAFFHWEVEFPRVFVGERPAFDAVLGNPPWDIQKPNSKEFFPNWDPIYRTSASRRPSATSGASSARTRPSRRSGCGTRRTSNRTGLAITVCHFPPGTYTLHPTRTRPSRSLIS